MTPDSTTTVKAPGFAGRVLNWYWKETGQSLGLWLLVALLSFATQIIFRRELALGEFGTLNTALAVIGMLTVPVIAVNQAFVWYLARPHPAERQSFLVALRDAKLLITETLAWAWAAISFLLLFLVLPLVYLPRFSLELFVLLNVVVGLGGFVSSAICEQKGQWRLWGSLLLASAVARVLIGVGTAGAHPWAETGLAAFLVAGFITLVPALREQGTATATERLQALRTALDFDFLLYTGATFSVLLAIFLFINADRIVAQAWFGTRTSNNIGYVNWTRFDAYQTAGLLGRSILWGTQPLLFVLFTHRSRLNRTTAASLTFFWLYLGALFSGAVTLWLLARPLCQLFCGNDFESTASFIPIFTLTMIPLGFLQGLAIFALASRRYHECFVLGGSGVAYTLLLYLVGRRPELMPAYMFGGGLVILMLALFVGVVRWGRKQP